MTSTTKSMYGEDQKSDENMVERVEQLQECLDLITEILREIRELSSQVRKQRGF